VRPFKWAGLENRKAFEIWDVSGHLGGQVGTESGVCPARNGVNAFSARSFGRGWGARAETLAVRASFQIKDSIDIVSDSMGPA
jgi:hypothetical protein